MHCDAATVAYATDGINPQTGNAYKPWHYQRYIDDATLVRAYNNCPKGSHPVLLGCGRCLLCTRRYRQHWVLRCLNELRTVHSGLGCFLTLTVADPYLYTVFPRLDRERYLSLRYGKSSLDYVSLDSNVSTDSNVSMDSNVSTDSNASPRSNTFILPSLHHRYWQLFAKRLRIYAKRKLGIDSIRFYMCGEYGDKSLRPHYHALLFGYMPQDARPLLADPRLLVSPEISQLWPYGYHTVEPLHRNNISYVAGYVDKKINRNRLDYLDYGLAPEYVAMSRRPGIGGEFWNRYHDSDLYPQNADGTFARLYALIGQRGRVKMPKYYDELLRLHDPEKFANLIASRQVAVAESEMPVADWLSDSHRRHAVALARYNARSRDLSVVPSGYSPLGDRQLTV